MTYKLQILAFNTNGIDKIKQIIRSKKLIYFNKTDPTINIDAKYTSRVNKSGSSIKFLVNVDFKSNDILLIADNNIIYSVYLKQNLENNKDYRTSRSPYIRSFIYIQTKSSYMEYKLDITKIIGVVKNDDQLEDSDYWRDIANEICINDNNKFNDYIYDISINVSLQPSLSLLPATAAAKTNTPTQLATAAVKTNTPTQLATAAAKTNTPNQLATAAAKTNTPTQLATAAAKTNTPTQLATAAAAKTNTPTQLATAAAKTNTPNQPATAAAAKTNTPNQSNAVPNNTRQTVMSRTSEKKLKKFLSTSVYKEHKKNLQNLSVQNCKQIIEELQKIVDLSSDNKPKPLIKNPKTILNPTHKPYTVNYDSDIVLTALSRCYYDPNLNVKDVLEVIDLVTLYSEDKASAIQSTTVQINTTLYDVINPVVIQEYQKSCDSLKIKTEIEFSEYVSHMQKLFLILQEIYNYNKVSNSEITIYLFDENTKQNYYTNFGPFALNNMTRIDRGIIFDNKTAVKNGIDVLKNTYLNRAIHLRFFTNQNIIFNHTYNHNNYNDVFEFRRYMSILPKFHCLNSSTVLKTKENEIIINMLLELNKFTANFPTQYTIKNINKDIYEKLFQTISSYTEYNQLNQLLYVLINNNYNKKQYIDDYYYYFNYDGPAPAISTINAVDYVKNLKIYQPININALTLYNIELYYKGKSPLFSRVVNEALQNHILNGIKLTENTTNKMEYVLKYAQYTHRDFYNKEDIYIFHGTQNLMHAKGEKEINLISFLSCSFNIYISIDYALNNLTTSVNSNKKGIIYIFRINDQQNYINFNDSLYQIILLPGTKIKIQYEINIGNIKYILCYIDDTDVLNYGRKLLDDIKEGTELLKTIYNIKKYKITGDSKIYPSIINMNFPKNQNDMKQFRQNVANIYVMSHNQNEYIYTSLGKLINDYDMHSYNNIQYTIHQLFFSDCYYYFNANCVLYHIGYDDDNIYTVWEVDSNFGPSYTDFKYKIKNLLIDCLLSNIDCTNSKNYLVLNSDKSISRLMTFKGCGMFNVSGYRKPRFNKKQEPYEYLGIIGEIMRTTPNMQNIDRAQLRSLLKCDNFLIQILDFTEFVNHTHNKYNKFLISNLQIASVSQEFKDLKQMLDDLKDILTARVKYFQTKMDDIIDNILEYIQDTYTASVVTGGNTISEFNMQNFTNQNIIYKNKTANTELVKQISRSRNSTYEMIKNIPMPTDTKYTLKQLKEPYKSYYMKIIKESEKANHRTSEKISSQNTKYDSYMIDTYNEGYCVSNETFAEIKNKLSMSTSKK